MGRKFKSKPRKLNKNLQEVAQITNYGYGYVKQVAAGFRSNNLIERAIIAFEEQDFAALQEIKLQAAKRTTKNQ